MLLNPVHLLGFGIKKRTDAGLADGVDDGAAGRAVEQVDVPAAVGLALVSAVGVGVVVAIGAVSGDVGGSVHCERVCSFFFLTSREYMRFWKDKTRVDCWMRVMAMVLVVDIYRVSRVQPQDVNVYKFERKKERGKEEGSCHRRKKRKKKTKLTRTLPNDGAALRSPGI